jgi:hypothetical protein
MNSFLKSRNGVQFKVYKKHIGSLLALLKGILIVEFI